VWKEREIVAKRQGNENGFMDVITVSQFPKKEAPVWGVEGCLVFAGIHIPIWLTITSNSF
jgi:hypothetical protein